MSRIFIGLGSNLGDRSAYLEKAVTELSKLSQTFLRQRSSIYETEPVGVKEQPDFLNMIAGLESSLPPAALAKQLKEIESRLGRSPRERWGPREIDLDLLYYGAEIINEPELQVPHPEIHRRKFVLVPLNEIAGELIDPLRQLSVVRLLQRCSDTSFVRRIAAQHAGIKEEP